METKTFLFHKHRHRYVYYIHICYLYNCTPGNLFFILVLKTIYAKNKILGIKIARYKPRGKIGENEYKGTSATTVFAF